MAVSKINIQEFITLAREHSVIDVRSEGEYHHAHIPSAVSLPLFNNEERKVVGTAYKQQSRKAAIKIGLDFFGKNMRPLVEEVEKLMEERKKPNETSADNIVLVHCWRGGMRSGAVAWLLDLYGFKVYTLTGGYKAFRNWVLKQFEIQYNFQILGGYTGSGKTYVLQQLGKQGESTINLEHLANHKGSAFGHIGLPPQPSQEMFENVLAVELFDKCPMTDDILPQQLSRTIWLEDESRRIGTVNIPLALWNTIRQKPVYFININFEERLQHIIMEYGQCHKEKLADAINRIQKRLGGLETKTALGFLQEGDIKECFRILLKYYDKQYLKALNNREASAPIITTVDCEIVTTDNAATLLTATKILQ